MRFTYETHDSLSKRLDITCNFNEITEDTFKFGNYVLISDNMSKCNLPIECLKSVGDYYAWRERLEKEHAWKPAAVDAIAVPTVKKLDPTNPPHYQSYFEMDAGFDTNIESITLQWLEAQQHLTRYRKNPDVFKGAIELQARKYLDRLGGKDESSQEIMKSVWYLKFLAAFIKNGNKPIRVKDINTILAG